jgi:hypothetical protein
MSLDLEHATLSFTVLSRFFVIAVKYFAVSPSCLDAWGNLRSPYQLNGDLKCLHAYV